MTPTSTTPYLDAALHYVQLGLNVLPLAGKRPRIAWQRLQTERATAQEVQDWARQWPDMNIGIVTGAISNLWVLDLDSGRAGDASLSQLEQQHGPLPPTPTVLTGSGGRHFYFRWTEDIANKVNVVLGLDLRGRGGYVVAPPSIHQSGRPYEWLTRPDSLNAAPAPAWLLTVLKARTMPSSTPTPTSGRPPSSLEVERARRYLEKCDPAISGQGGSPQTFKIACKLVRGFLLDPETAFELLWSVYNHRCVPPWSERELRHKIADAIKADGQVGYLRDTPMTPTQPAAPHTPSPRLAHYEASIDSQPIDYLTTSQLSTPYLLARQHTSIIYGQRDSNKSTLARLIATDLSNNGHAILYLSGEESYRTWILPQLLGMGANLTNLHVLKGIIEGPTQDNLFDLSPAKLRILEQDIATYRPSLIAFDPLFSYLPEDFTDKHHQVRKLITRLNRLTETHNLAVLGTANTNKDQSQDARNRMSGSGAWLDAPRFVYLMTRDPDDYLSNRRYLVVNKGNLLSDKDKYAHLYLVKSAPLLQKDGTPLAGKDGKPLTGPTLEYAGLTKETFESLTDPERPKKSDEPSALAEAIAFLRDSLSTPQLALDVEAHAKAELIAPATLKRAKKAVSVIVYQSTNPSGRHWYWRLPGP
jgi:hypothetical protein